MAIGTDAGIWFYGTADVVTAGGGTSAVNNDAFSASGDVVSGGWQNDDDAPMASFMLKFQYPSGTIADTIDLYVRLINNVATAAADEPQPDTGWKHHYLGSFVMDANQAATTDTYYTLGPRGLPSTESGQEYEFYVQNLSDVTMTAGWTLTVIPMTYGPHA